MYRPLQSQSASPTLRRILQRAAELKARRLQLSGEVAQEEASVPLSSASQADELKNSDVVGSCPIGAADAGKDERGSDEDSSDGDEDSDFLLPLDLLPPRRAGGRQRA
jgi:hypothetical protein